MPRSSKCREWEKERRNRFNEAFRSLAKVLPNYDPSVNLPKLDILIKAKTAIVDLQAQVATIANSEEKEAARTNQIKKFQNRIRVLLNRNEHLANLLKDAKITIPKHLEPIKIKKNYPWSGKIKPEQAEYFQKKEMEKENISQSSQMRRKVRTTKKTHKKAKTQVCRKNGINKPVGSKCVVVLPQSKYVSGAMTQGSATLCNAFSKAYVKSTGVTSNSKPICISGSALSSLGPGTLIFPNGTALPVMTQSSFYLPPTVTLLANPVPTLQVTTSKAVQKASPRFVLKQTVGVKKYTTPIISNICLTTTTQVNKVPIPALSTNYTNTVLLKSAKKTVASKPSASEGNKNCLKRKAPVLSSGASKKIKCDATSSNENGTVDDILTTVSTSSNCANKEGENYVNPKVDTANILKIPSGSCNADGEKSEVKINSDGAVAINSEKLTDKQNQVGISEPETNNLVIANDIQANYVEIVESQSVMDGKADVLEKSADLPPKTDMKKQATTTRNESSEKRDIVSAIEESIKPSCTKDTLPSGISQEVKTNHTHSELSNDIFGALTVGTSCQNPESTSPTAAFLMTFPLVSSVKATEVTDEENVDGHDTENLLQTSNIDTNKIALPDNLANSLLNLDTFSFFSCSNYLNKCSTASVNENGSSNIVYTNVKSPITQADFSESASRVHQEINKKSDSNENNKSSHQQVQCHDGHQKHNNITKETPAIEKFTHNEVVIVSPRKNGNCGFSNQSDATSKDKFKEKTYNPSEPKNKDKNSSKLQTYHEPLQNSSHLDIEQTANKNKVGPININSPSKISSNNTSVMPNSQKENNVGPKDLDSYYHDLNGLNVNNKGVNHFSDATDGNKNIPSVKCNEDNVGKNAINFNLPFITQNVFEQNVKDCYSHGRNDNLDSRIKSSSSENPQNTAINVLPNIGIYDYTNNWNLPKADDKLSGDKSSATYPQPDQTATKPTYEPGANKYNILVASDSKTTVSQDHRASVSENHTYSNSNKPNSKQTKSQEHLHNSTKELYDFNVSEAMTYHDRNKSNMKFCADKNTVSVSHQSTPNSTKYSINQSESSGNKNTVGSSRQGIQIAKKGTYGFNVSDPTTYMYPTSTYNSTSSSNVSESYILQNIPVMSKPVITPSTEYRSAEFCMHPPNVPLGFGSNHYSKIANSLKSTTASETFALNSDGDSKKFPESCDSRLQPSALQSDIINRTIAADNVHCANIFEDKNVTSSKQASGMGVNTLHYPLKTSEFGQNHIYTNYQHMTEFQSKSDNPARMANFIYPDRLSSTVNDRLPNSNIQHLYDKKQSSQVYQDRVSSKDEKQGSIGTLNQDMYGRKHKIGDFTNSRQKHGDSKSYPDDVMKKSNSALQQNEICYKEKAKSLQTVKNMNKADNDIFSAQTTIGIGNQSNKDGNQISQLYMMNLPSASCSYQTEDTKTCSYMNINKSYSTALYTNSTNYSRYNYTTDVSSNQNYYKPATSKPFSQDKLLEGTANLDANKYCVSQVKKTGGELKGNPFNPPVNWMTTADTKTDCFLPQLSTPSYTFATDEAKQYTWSTTKFSNIFEPPQAFVPHSMPSLPFNPSSLIEQKPKEKKTIQQENQSSFLSVSQLVDHNKNDSTSGPARVTARRNSGNRSKGTHLSKIKRIPKTDTVDKSVQNKQNSEFMVTNEYCYEQKPSNRNRNSTSYSAEALIGNQGNEFSNKKVVPAESKSLVTTNFLADSMVTYFPSMDDNYIPHNNFPTNNFSHNSFQSTSYSTNNFLYSTPSVAPTHAPPNSFETPPDFLSDSIAEMKDLNSKHSKLINKEEKIQTCNNSNVKKSRKKQTNESNSFETTFPPVNETSILAEDLLHNTFLAPTTPYPKTNLSQKQSNEFNANTMLPLPGLARSVGQSIESSPSLNTAGTSLTNFNLSTIFPEINKVSFSSETKYNFNS